MNHVFTLSPNGYFLTPPQSPVVDKPETGIYNVTIELNPMGMKVELERQNYDRFKLPKKIYGRVHGKRLRTIGRVYHDRIAKGKSTSILVEVR